MKRLLCFVGLHDWRLAHVVHVDASDIDDGPFLYECGGEDYHLECDRCGAEKIDSVRGVWVPRNYKPLTRG